MTSLVKSRKLPTPRATLCSSEAKSTCCALLRQTMMAAKNESTIQLALACPLMTVYLLQPVYFAKCKSYASHFLAFTCSTLNPGLPYVSGAKKR